MKLFFRVVNFALCAGVFFAASMAFADTAGVPAVAASGVPVVVGKVQSFADMIPSEIPLWLVTVIGFVSELLMRFIPTAKPRSWLVLISALFNAIGSVFGKASAFLDKFAQNLKQ